jgi:hypothetical protein
MRVRRTLAALLAVLLAGPCLLSACGGGGTSVADPPVSSSPTSSAPTTRQPEHESPEHFIRRWAAAEKRMENTGKTHAYLSLSEGCIACATLAQTVAGYYRSGGFIHWSGWTIKSIEKYPSSGIGVAFAVRSDSAPTTYRESSAQAVKHLDGGSITYVLHLKRAPTSFHVASKVQLDQ